MSEIVVPFPFPWRRRPSLSVLVGLSDLRDALHLGSPSVVANWRARSESFPLAKVSTPPMFELAAVVEWLCSGNSSGRSSYQISPRRWFRLLARAYVHEVPSLMGTAESLAAPGASSAGMGRPAARNSLVALVLLHHLAAERNVQGLAGSWREMISDIENAAASVVIGRLCAMASRIEDADPSLRGDLLPYLAVPAAVEPLLADLVDAVDLVARFGTEVPGSKSVWTASTRLGVVLRSDHDIRSRQVTNTAEAIAALMAALAAPEPGASVFDPAVGEGNILAACARRYDGVRLFGQEIDTSVRSIARAVLEVEGTHADLGATAADSLRSDQHADLRASVVVVDPPSVEAEQSLEPWLVHALRHVDPDGRVVMLLPAHSIVNVAAARRRPDRMLRERVRWLAAAGRLETAVVLPRNLRSDVVGPMVALSIAANENAMAIGPMVVAILAEHRSDADRVIAAVADRLERLAGSSLHSAEGAVHDAFEGVPEAVVYHSSAADFLTALDDVVSDVDRTSSKRGAPRRARSQFDNEDSPKKGTDNDTPWGAVSVTDAKRVALPEQLVARSSAPLNASVAPPDSIAPAVRSAIDDLLHAVDANRSLFSEALQQRLHPYLERVRRLLDQP